jgi:hypothetical protein
MPDTASATAELMVSVPFPGAARRDVGLVLVIRNCQFNLEWRLLVLDEIVDGHPRRGDRARSAQVLEDTGHVT